MSKKSKRTISSLLESRPSGRFAPRGFDLLGEGDKLVTEETQAQEISPSASMPSMKVPYPAAAPVQPSSPLETLASEKFAIANFTQENPAIEKNTTVKSAKAKIAAEENAVAVNTFSGPEPSSSLVSVGVKNTTVKSAQENPATANFAVAKDTAAMSAIAKFVQENSADVKFAIAGNAQVKPATAKTTLVGNGSNEEHRKSGKYKATKLSYKSAQEELMQLREQPQTATLIDNYVMDRLLAELGPTLSIIYIYLWRRTVGSGVGTVNLSMQVLSEALGISKRTAQQSVKKLNELNLLRSSRECDTGVSEHQILKPWETKQPPTT